MRLGNQGFTITGGLPVTEMNPQRILSNVA